MSALPTISEGELEWTIAGLERPVKTWYRIHGDLASATPSRRPLVVIHGGPGGISDYLFPLTDLAAGARGVPVVFYDQIGNGRSTRLRSRAGDVAFWTERVFLAELHALLAHLRLDQYDVLGHSWGGMLAARFAAAHPPGLTRLVIASAPASMELWIKGVNGLRAQLPPEMQAKLDKHEREGTTDSKEYMDLVMVFYGKHICRIDPMPAEANAVFGAFEEDPTVYGTMLGPSEFFVTGTLKTWTVINDIAKINVPTLLLNGRYDEAQDLVMEPFFRLLPKVRWYTFAEASHFGHLEERTRFMELVGEFLV